MKAKRLEEILSTPLFGFSQQKEDVFTFRDAFEGVKISGSIGAGKTSGSGKCFARAYLQAGFGGLVLCAKASEVGHWQHLAQATGRSNDLLIFSPEDGQGFNFFQWLVKNGTDEGTTVQNLTRMLDATLLQSGGKETEEFWKNELQKLLLSSLDLSIKATGTINLPGLIDLILSAPVALDELEDVQWKQQSACFAFLQKVADRQAAFTEVQKADIRQTLNYWLQEYIRMPAKTRMNVVSSVTGILGKFLRSPFRELFCQETTVTPDMSRHGKVIILNLPVDRYGEIGRLAQILFTYIWQQAMLSVTGLPVFLWADEAQTFITKSTADFQARCREYMVATVYLTQSLATLEFGLGNSPTAKAIVRGLLGNLSTQVFHRQDHSETRLYASELIGRSKSSSQSGGTSFTNKDSSVQFGWNDQRDFIIHPEEFSQLATGGSINNYQVEAIIYSGGRRFSNGKQYLKVKFQQET